MQTSNASKQLCKLASKASTPQASKCRVFCGKARRQQWGASNRLHQLVFVCMHPVHIHTWVWLTLFLRCLFVSPALHAVCLAARQLGWSVGRCVQPKQRPHESQTKTESRKNRKEKHITLTTNICLLPTHPRQNVHMYAS